MEIIETFCRKNVIKKKFGCTERMLKISHTFYGPVQLEKPGHLEIKAFRW